jgi:hypothetical protein
VRGLACALAVAAALTVCAGCGGEAKSPAVVRVGAAQVDRATVEHWTRVFTRGQAIGGFDDEAQGSPSQRALALLISASWLRGEAAAQGVAPSRGAVEQALNDRREANGEAEFKESLRAAGQTVADVTLELEAELAATAIRRKVISQSPAVTEAEVADYYRRNSHQFRNPEKRTAELIEDLPSPAAATALVARIGTGSKFSKRALHENLQINAGERLEPDIERSIHAVFRARPGVVSAPIGLNGHWAVFIVRKITPSSLKPLAKVRPAILTHLTEQHRAATLSAFTSSYRTRWTAKTSCQPAYVVQGCAQYAGPARPQANPFPSE